MDHLAEIRPKLKQDTVFLQTSMGVFFPGEGAPFILKGKSISQWISKLGPYMNGQYTLEDLCKGLSQEKRDILIQIVQQLIERGLVKNSFPEDVKLLPVEVRKRFLSQIEYIDHYVDTPLQRFKAFRESRILLIGAGESYLALARSLIHNGLQHIFLAPTEDAEHYLQTLVSECEADTEVFLSSPGGGDYGLIAYCSDHSQYKDIYTIQKRCIEERQAFIATTIFAGQAMIGPLFRPESGPCWFCAQMRSTAHLTAHQQAAFWQRFLLDDTLADQGPALFAAVARKIGNGLAFELFKTLTAVFPPETEQGVILQNLETLESYHSKLLRHPLCPLCSLPSVQTELSRLEQLVATHHDCLLSQKELLKEAYHLVAAQVGPFQKFADDTLLQLPLKITKLVANSPLSPLSNQLEVTAYSVEHLDDARSAAFAAMVNMYAQAMPDSRRMLLASAHELLDQGKRVIAAGHIATFSGIGAVAPDTRTRWLPAFSLLDMQICYVPAASVYSSSSLNQQRIFERTQAGSVAAPTFQQMLRAGTLSAFAYEHLCALLRGQCSLLKIVPRAMEDDDLTFLLRCVTHSEQDITIFELCQESPLHVMIAHTSTAEPITTIGVGLSGREALTDALCALIGNLQLVQSGESIPVTRNMLEFSLSSELHLANPTLSRFEEPEVTFEQFKDYLVRIGREILFVNTTTADIWETATFMSGTVLLSNIPNA